MRKTKLQKLLEDAFKKSASSNGFTKEDWDKALKKFAIECYIKALQGKLVEIDYKGNQRLVRSESNMEKYDDLELFELTNDKDILEQAEEIINNNHQGYISKKIGFVIRDYKVKDKILEFLKELENISRFKMDSEVVTIYGVYVWDNVTKQPMKFRKGLY